MSDIREKMLKAGLITEAQATQAEVERPRGGGPDGQRGGGKRRGGRGRGRRGGGSEGPPASVEASADASEVAEASRIAIKGRGSRRWYYVSREGLVPFVELPEDAADKLGRGDVALVESPEGVTWLVPREAAHRIARLDEAWLRAFNPS